MVVSVLCFFFCRMRWGYVVVGGVVGSEMFIGDMWCFNLGFLVS